MRHSSLCFTAFVLTGAVLPGPPAAQPAPTQHPFCWHAAPEASCSVIILTGFGVYAFGGSRERVTGFDPVTGLPTGFSRPIRVGARATGDWGLLLNVGQRDAVGGSVFGSAETTSYGDQFELGGWPGFALSSLGGAILGIVTLIHLGNSD